VSCCIRAQRNFATFQLCQLCQFCNFPTFQLSFSVFCFLFSVFCFLFSVFCFLFSVFLFSVLCFLCFLFSVFCVFCVLSVSSVFPVFHVLYRYNHPFRVWGRVGPCGATWGCVELRCVCVGLKKKGAESRVLLGADGVRSAAAERRQQRLQLLPHSLTAHSCMMHYVSTTDITQNGSCDHIGKRWKSRLRIRHPPGGVTSDSVWLQVVRRVASFSE